jgi:hypothetical protein
MTGIVPQRINYEQRVVAVLKATAVNRCTITLSALCWAIDYQRTTRPIEDLLAYLRPIFEDHKWPPLTALAIDDATQQPNIVGVDWRLAQRQCWAWAEMSSTERANLSPTAGEGSAS